MCPSDRRPVVVGRVSGVYGVKGWVRVFSFTDPPENILNYGPWSLGDGVPEEFRVEASAVHGRSIVAHLDGIDDRDVARRLIGAVISVPRDRFSSAGPEEYYWSDLIGLQVINADGAPLGTVAELLETGSNDVLVVQGDRRRLLPFVHGDVVREVDLGQGVIRVDWDPDF